MVLLVLAPLLLGVVAYRLPLAWAKGALVLGQVVALAYTGYLFAPVAGGQSQVVDSLGGFFPYLYIELRGTSFSLGLVLMTGVLFLATSAWVVTHASNKLILLLLALQGLCNGIFLTDDIFNLFVILEVVTIVLVLLNVFHRERRSIYDALYYLIIQLVGMTFFLLGVAYVYRAFGQLSMNWIEIAGAAGMADPTALAVAFALILTGLALKVGLFPLFSYVPRFYGNPGAPVVVLLLSSALISTAAIYWIGRVYYAFGWHAVGSHALSGARALLVALGLLTAVGGAAKALAQRNILLVLAFSTVSQSGLALLALANHPAGFLSHLFTHAVAKALLFLGALLLVERYGTTDVRELRAVVFREPLAALALLVGGLSLIGVPLTAGSTSKYLIMEVGTSGLDQALVWVVTVGTVLIIAKLLLPIKVVGANETIRARAALPKNLRLRNSADHAVVVPEKGNAGARGAFRDLSDGALSQRFVEAAIVVLALLVLLGGLLGPWAMRAGLGYWYPISAGALALKGVQLAVLIAAVLAARAYIPTRWWARAATPLSDSLALPDACLALAAFFACVIAYLLVAPTLGVGA